MRLRKNQSDAEQSSGIADTRKNRRRERRGWGPFSGGQLTIIIVTLAIVIGFPVAAFSVTGSATNIVDPVTAANKAKVDAKGNLNGAIHDATSGIAAKVDAKNNLYTATRDAASGVAAKVNSLGSQLVVAKPDPVMGFSRQINFPDTNWIPVRMQNATDTGNAPAKALVVAHIDVFTSASGAIQFALSSATDNCTGTPDVFDAVDQAPTGATELNFGGGFTAPPGEVFCIRDTNPTSFGAVAFLYGY